MTTLYHEIEVVTSPDRVWSLLTTRVGLNRWWPGEIFIHGGDSWRLQQEDRNMALVFKVVEEVPDRVLEWLCTQGEDDWHNTLVHWRIERHEAKLRLIVEHRDLRKTPEELARLNTQWGVWVDRIGRQLHQEIDTMDDKDLNAWT
ncbi:SRPBCC family protein [Reinekea sp.]|uniref:SRPBCC family protein n=1 Tax=Reinekea sp. TaxID=1970455 RepID=UPI002A81A413|nr:SRPBCC domain-containing protein [Reinekea sp.]